MSRILETAQRNDLKKLVEECKDLLQINYDKILEMYGITRDVQELTPIDNLVDYAVLETEEEKKSFENTREEIHQAVQGEYQALEDWKEAYTWYLDRLVYTFLNRIFAIRVMDELNLLRETTIVPRPDLGNRSERMAKIQKRFPEKSNEAWYKDVLMDAFSEISQDVKILFEETDISTRIWPGGEVIEQVIEKLNGTDNTIYSAEDCIGWFYHYYVLKFRKGYKTMSSHGNKSPKNPFYLSILIHSRSRRAHTR